ncbi:hypothetical protein MAPG_07304 [Magnaporthiopsis poae ATCC 64411]|uniref:Uncharacterized protein n=1 Tax=Magnaporthiopsis poae (strain ATCC 64411 / 73-15) TaxID=644358 RepID=A0A0C4E4B2_MAGP6|nr:hypothetical protein MAPG_07304 [Magnaporthiopsis poae ATCC 64411]
MLRGRAVTGWVARCRVVAVLPCAVTSLCFVRRGARWDGPCHPLTDCHHRQLCPLSKHRSSLGRRRPSHVHNVHARAPSHSHFTLTPSVPLPWSLSQAKSGQAGSTKGGDHDNRSAQDGTLGTVDCCRRCFRLLQVSVSGKAGAEPLFCLLLRPCRAPSPPPLTQALVVVFDDGHAAMSSDIFCCVGRQPTTTRAQEARDIEAPGPLCCVHMYGTQNYRLASSRPRHWQPLVRPLPCNASTLLFPGCRKSVRGFRPPFLHRPRCLAGQSIAVEVSYRYSLSSLDGWLCCYPHMWPDRQTSQRPAT